MADFATIDKNDAVIQNLKAEWNAINKLYQAATDPAAKAAYDAQRYAIHQKAEERRNDLGYSGDIMGNPESFVGIVTTAADAAASVINKVTAPAADLKQTAADPEETKVVYSAFDPSGYATITPEVASETGGKILGYGIIAVIGLVILDKLFA